VVAEHDVRPAESRQQGLELRGAAGSGQEVARQTDEIGLSLLDPGDRALDGAGSARRHTEVEVGQMRDTQPVELGRQPGQFQLELAQPDPTGFEPAVGDRGCRERRGAREDAGARQIWSFSRIGLTETT